jgi:hypothetical protein
MKARANIRIGQSPAKFPHDEAEKKPKTYMRKREMMPAVGTGAMNDPGNGVFSYPTTNYASVEKCEN